MHVIERIGPALGIVAFLGLAILVFLLFQQARDIRRLREWAGRAPERAKEAVEASLAAAEARGEAVAEETPSGLRARLAGLRHRLGQATLPRMREFDRRSPVALRYLAGGLVLALIAVGVVTSGFGLVGGESGKAHHHGGRGNGSKLSVAVLNGTGTAGLAADVQKQVVEPAGYRTGVVTNTPSKIAQTMAMYDQGHSADARALATAVKPKLGETIVSPMTADIRSRVNGAPLALVLGLDDASFGSTGTG